MDVDPRCGSTHLRDAQRSCRHDVRNKHAHPGQQLPATTAVPCLPHAESSRLARHRHRCDPVTVPGTPVAVRAARYHGALTMTASRAAAAAFGPGTTRLACRPPPCPALPRLPPWTRAVPAGAWRTSRPAWPAPRRRASSRTAPAHCGWPRAQLRRCCLARRVAGCVQRPALPSRPVACAGAALESPGTVGHARQPEHGPCARFR